MSAEHARIQAVTRVFEATAETRAVQALGPIDFDIGRGEFVAVVGPSGCGKSTLLDIVAGLARPTAGTVTFEDQPVVGPPDGVGVVFQQDAAFAWLSVIDNVAFGLRRRGMAARAAREVAAEALAMTGLSEFATAYPAQLSGGMRQRVCIARTLVLRPRLLLLDEPFGALDAQTRLLMGDELLQIWRQSGASVMLITHSLEEAALLADRVAVMSARPGRIIAEIATGWPAERDSRLVEDPRFGRLTAELWSHLREEARQAMATQKP